MRWLLLLVAGCGRIGFDAPGDAPGDAPAEIDLDLTRGDPAGVAFARASIATYVAADRGLRIAVVDAPRFDHDPSSGAPRGLLIEGAADNLVDDSEDLSTARWFTNGDTVVTGDVAIAPDGTMSADEVDDQDPVKITRRGQIVEVADDTQRYAYAQFVHAGTTAVATFEAELLGGAVLVQPYVNFDLSTGTIEEPLGIAESFGLEPHADGWWRVWMVLRNNGTGNTLALISTYGSRKDDASLGSVYAWGAQIERGDHPTSYIPTTVAPGRRAADVASVIGAATDGPGTLEVTADDATSPTAACFLGALCIGRVDGHAAMVVEGTPVGGGPVGGAVTATWDATGTRIDGASTPRVPGASGELRLGSDGTAFLDGHVQRVRSTR